MFLDGNLIAEASPVDQQIFTGGTWQQWERPRNVSMIHIVAIGSGAGGGGGLTGLTGTARGGAGGGGSGAIACCCGPLWLLPDFLYVNAGVGGAGNGSGQRISRKR